MLTVKQKEELLKLKEGKLTPKQKADFYYRLSKILKNEVESTIKEIGLLIDEIPDSYLKKIDFYTTAIDSLALLEKLVERLEPAPAFGLNEGLRVIREFRVEVDNPLPNIAISQDDIPIIAFVRVTYEPTIAEVEFLNKLKKFVDNIERIIDYSTKDFRNYKSEDFNKKLKKLEDKQKFEIKIGTLIGAKDGTPE